MLKDAPVDNPGVEVATSAPRATCIGCTFCWSRTTSPSYGRLPPARAHGSSCRRGRRRDGRGAGGTLDALRTGPDRCDELPGMDGLTATRYIRSEPGRNGCTPIIGLTASAEPGNEVACRRAGMDGFVSKPVTAERLAAAIRRRYAGCRAEDQDACCAVTGCGVLDDLPMTSSTMAWPT